MCFHIWVSVSICYDRSLTLRQHLNEGVNKETDFVTKWEHVFVTCLSCLQNVFSLVKEVSVYFSKKDIFAEKNVCLLFQSKNVEGNFGLKRKGQLSQQKWKSQCNFFLFSLCFFLSLIHFYIHLLIVMSSFLL